MNISRSVCKILLINLIFYQCVETKYSFTSFFSKKYYDEIIQKQFPISLDGEVIINNINGDIEVREWNKQKVQVKITKKSSKKEFLDFVNVKIQSSKKKISISVEQKKEAKDKVNVTIELVVPENTSIKATTEKGNIKIDNLRGSVKAKTKSGNVNIANIKSPVQVATDYGSITIYNSPEDIRAYALNGNITIEEAETNIFARTKKGAIHTSCKNGCSLETISLSTQSGHITLDLPEEVGANVQARTKKGKLTSDHFITTKPRTTKLNKRTWAQVKKEVDVTIGDGEASIKLTAGSGNIKIRKTT